MKVAHVAVEVIVPAIVALVQQRHAEAIGVVRHVHPCPNCIDPPMNCFFRLLCTWACHATRVQLLKRMENNVSKRLVDPSCLVSKVATIREQVFGFSIGEHYLSVGVSIEDNG